jgi:hypothetical protein
MKGYEQRGASDLTIFIDHKAGGGNIRIIEDPKVYDRSEYTILRGDIITSWDPKVYGRNDYTILRGIIIDLIIQKQELC